ncbi:hypothetical protein [Cohnella mopanensis]|uniref:hypothetical protein n=1 Tax=Cohnella mopanensis TaxID=2911966 RepID=UPI001EF78A85|nr:hypothetical protein [Cohnella mopanensis]
MKWNKSLSLIALIAVLLLVACSNKEGGSKGASPEEKLFEVRNYLTKNLWNNGFVDVSWYIGSGTSSTGETLDIDFTMERLGKAVEKKAEYDEYINGLDAKYDSVKKVWTKLSAEIDHLYGQLKDKPPVANDKESKFDTGLFSQYNDAFDDEVDAFKVTK